MSNQIEQIRAVVDQRRKAQLDKNGNAKDLFCAVRLWAYADLLGILDTIPEHPVPTDLEAEINREIQKLRTAPCYDELRNFARHFHAAGMLAERERLMKEAPVADVIEMSGSTDAEYPFVLTLGFPRIPNIEYHGGKVRATIEEIK